MNELEQQAIQSPMGKEKWPKRTVDVLLSNEKYTGMRFLILRKEMWSIFLRIITRLLYQRNIPGDAA